MYACALDLSIYLNWPKRTSGNVLSRKKQLRHGLFNLDAIVKVKAGPTNQQREVT